MELSSILWIFLSHLHPHSPPFLESDYCRFHMSGHVVIVFQWELFIAPLLPSSPLDDLCWNCQNSWELLPVFRFLVPSSEEEKEWPTSFHVHPNRKDIFASSNLPTVFFQENVSEELWEAGKGNWSSSYYTSEVTARGQRLGNLPWVLFCHKTPAVRGMLGAPPSSSGRIGLKEVRK